MKQSLRISLKLFAGLLAVSLWLSGPASQLVMGHGTAFRHRDRIVSFPAQPDPDAIGTQVGNIGTYVTEVTLSPPESIHRFGSSFSEIRGTIKGVGWGGAETAASLLNCPYTYELPYVLRIPPGWSGGLVIYRHQFDQLAGLEAWEAFLGDRNFARLYHEAADRYASDVALHPSRRWAFFAVNQSGVSPGGAHNTLILDAPGCVAGTPTQSTRDVTIARDHALLAQFLLSALRGRAPEMTLGVGYVQGALTNFALNAGVRGGVDASLAGDNHRTPYDATTGLIFDGFLAISGGLGVIQPANLGGLSAPTVFVAGEADALQRGAVSQLSAIANTPSLNVEAMARLYSVRNMPLLSADFSLSLTRDDIDWAEAVLPDDPDPPAPEYFRGSGDQLRPLSAALLDSLANWVARGIPPPFSLFNGDVQADRIEFHRTGPLATTLPYLDDPDLDVWDSPPAGVDTTAASAANLRTQWANVRNTLGGTLGSVVLPETACRRGSFAFLGGGPIGASVRHVDESTFLSRWGTPSAYQSCRVHAQESLDAAGLYDPTFVPIDVDPDHAPNTVDVRSRGWLAVAIFSTNGFDARAIAPSSLRLAGASQQGVAVSPGDIRSRLMDVNGDGRKDLQVEFRVRRLRFSAADIVADLWGYTRRGVPFAGSDLIEIVAAP